MKQNSHVKSIAGIIIFIVALYIPLILYASNFRLIVFNEHNYKAAFEKYDIYAKFPNAGQINELVLDYFNDNSQELITIDFFNEKEKLHLLDVKQLMQSTFFTLYTTLIAFIINCIILAILAHNNKTMMRYFLQMFMLGSGLTLVITALILVAFMASFSWIFTQFHILAFDNDLWLMDPSSDILVLMYPEGFFYSMAIKIILAVLSEAILILAVSFLIRQRFKNTLR